MIIVYKGTRHEVNLKASIAGSLDRYQAGTLCLRFNSATIASRCELGRESLKSSGHLANESCRRSAETNVKPLPGSWSPSRALPSRRVQGGPSRALAGSRATLKLVPRLGGQPLLTTRASCSPASLAPCPFLPINRSWRPIRRNTPAPTPPTSRSTTAHRNSCSNPCTLR